MQLMVATSQQRAREKYGKFRICGRFAGFFEGHLKKTDLKVRRFVRDLLHLLHDVLSSAFHIRVKDDGMGILCLRWTVPAMTLQRLSVHQESFARSFFLSNR